MSSSSSTEDPSQVLPLIEPPSMNRGNGNAQSRGGGGGNLDFPISSTDARRIAKGRRDPSMSTAQRASNASNRILPTHNSGVNTGGGAHFQAAHFTGGGHTFGSTVNNKTFTIIRCGDGQFTKSQRDLICNSIANHANLPDINHNLNRKFLIQSIINLPRAEAVFDDYQTKKKSGPCFEGTRVALLREMAEWVTGLNESRMYVLSGLAGIGKSTVAYTVASRAASLNLLGASFFFSRDESDRKNAKKFFTTIAYQLCVYKETFAKAIGDVLQTHRGSVAITKDPEEQLQALIVNPLQSIGQSRVRPILVVVDALDECDEEDALSVLTGLKQLVRALPSFKVILTTRPQPHLDRFFGSQDGHKIFHLQDIEDKVVDDDIRLYLNHRLSPEKVQERLPTSQWCASDKELDALVGAAGRLFIIASTVVKIILDKVASNPADQMQRLLDTFAQDRMPFKDLNEFYTVILRNVVPPDCDVNIVNRYQSVVGAIIFVQHPLPVTTLAHLIDVSVDDIRVVLVNLRSVILLGDDDIPRIYHKSFPDYITDSKLCQDIKLRIDPMMRHTQITIRCFQIMDKHLKRNILGFGDPARFMSNEDGLKADGITDEQIQEKIPQQLRYACAYWVNHLEVTNMEDEALTNGLERFAYKHMLYWLEVLSLIGKLDSAHRVVGAVLKLLMSTSSDLHQLLSDALHFISKFYEIIKRSALHTYYSALPFTPTNSLLYHRYIKEAEHNICSVEGGPEKWDGFVVANLRHEEYVEVIKFSLDSTLFLSCFNGYVDEGIRKQGKLKIWDAATGTPISTIPGDRFAVANDFSTVASSQDNIATLYDMKGSPSGTMFTTSSKIKRLALSSESSRFAAELSDRTVWLWDSGNAELIDRFDDGSRSWYGTLLQFSSTGAKLAYSSAIGIKLRDGISGRFITDLRCGPRREFKFSGDGSRIASRLEDGLTLLWNTESGELIDAATTAVHCRCMAISANGSLLATADLDRVTLWSENRDHLTKIKVLEVDAFVESMAFSLDNILALTTSSETKLYNVNTNSFIHTFTLGGTDRIIPPAFSPDCTRLAVGDRDGDVNLWDIRGIDTSSPPSKGNATAVTALTLSRDCSRLACGFLDGTVELWETSPTKRRIDPLVLRLKMEKFFFRIFRQSRRHTEPVRALGFDPAGRLFASGSDDRTIKLWNGVNGVLRGTIKVPGRLQAVALSNSVLVATWKGWGRRGRDDHGGVTLWSLDTRRIIHTLKKSNDMAFKVSIAENSTLIAVCLRRSHVTLFDAVNRTTIRTFNVPSDIDTMAFLPDNSHLVVQSDRGVFQSFDLVNNHTTEGPTLEHLVQLPNTPLWHGVPVWHCRDEEQHYFAALFSEHKHPVPVLWIPKQILVQAWTQGSSMVALSCEDGRVILLRLPTGHVS
ncbi:hypothetical protein M378DRAFT_16425 [Amanita muscaria Koide BX008]|uniref:NACHT domain-containing protein n=1 Tax=Amanita muscaria (strain Koide BX008) TaxID=946122 RepID=A0A0C2WLT0_AMAMK|nr:hypothetical protein M378DRAFT_16425 [Amanita muscaria Koide BX008]